MNRKLQIHIDQSIRIEPSLSPSQHLKEESDEDSEHYEEEGHSSEEEASDEQLEQSSYSPQARTHSENIYDNIQTFGNTQVPNKPPLTQLSFNDTSKMPTNPNQLPLTPIDPISYVIPPRTNQDESLETQVNRIISKVLNKSSTTSGFTGPGYKREIEQVRKIDQVNNQLLKENTAIMSEINKLEKKLAKITKKSPIKSNKSQAKSSYDTSRSRVETGHNFTIKQYKQKLAKAQQLNSKLSSRLQTEKSRRRNMSQMLKSTHTARQCSHEELKGLSTIRSFVKDEQSRVKGSVNKGTNNRKRSNKSELSSRRHVYCEKCKGQVNNKKIKSPGLSPVFQLKDYQIDQMASPATNEFHLPVPKCEIGIQASPQEESMLLSNLQWYDEEEERLQAIIESNKKIIERYESRFERMLSEEIQ